MFTSGFYDSLNGDRKYTSAQMSSIFDGVITDGVYGNIYELFATVPGDGMEVVVKTGRAWFNNTWSLNDSWLPLDIEIADPLLNRIDAVVLEVNKTIEVRENTIKIVKGEPSVNAEKPTMTKSGDVYQYPLAYVTIRAEATEIKEADIEIMVGRDETPLVTSPLKTVPVDDLFNQWNGQFSEWFENLKAQLTDNVVTNLQYQIDQKVNKSDKATAADIKAGTVGKWVDASTVKEAMDVANSMEIGDITFSTRNLEELTNGVLIACDQREVYRSAYTKLFDSFHWLDSRPTSTLKIMNDGIASNDPHNWAPFQSSEIRYYSPPPIVKVGNEIRYYRFLPDAISNYSSTTLQFVLVYAVLNKPSTVKLAACVPANSSSAHPVSAMFKNVGNTFIHNGKIYKIWLSVGTTAYPSGGVYLTGVDLNITNVTDYTSGSAGSNISFNLDKVTTKEIVKKIGSRNSYETYLYFISFGSRILILDSVKPNEIYYTDDLFTTVYQSSLSFPPNVTAESLTPVVGQFTGVGCDTPFKSILQKDRRGYLYYLNTGSYKYDTKTLTSAIVYRSTDSGKSWSAIYYSKDGVSANIRLGSSGYGAHFGVVNDRLILLYRGYDYRVENTERNRLLVLDLITARSVFDNSLNDPTVVADSYLCYANENEIIVKGYTIAGVDGPTVVRINLSNGKCTPIGIPEYVSNGLPSTTGAWPTKGDDTNGVYSHPYIFNGSMGVSKSIAASDSSIHIVNAFLRSRYSAEKLCPMKESVTTIWLGGEPTHIKTGTSSLEPLGFYDNVLYLKYPSGTRPTSGTIPIPSVLAYDGNVRTIPYYKNGYIKVKDS